MFDVKYYYIFLFYKIYRSVMVILSKRCMNQQRLFSDNDLCFLFFMNEKISYLYSCYILRMIVVVQKKVLLCKKLFYHSD